MDSAAYCREQAGHYRRLAQENTSLRGYFEILAREYDELGEYGGSQAGQR
jgi:hypothetical protein